MHEFRALSNASASMGLADVSWNQELVHLGTTKSRYSSAAVKKRAVKPRKRGAGWVEGCHQYPLGVLFSSTAVDGQQERDFGCRSRRWFVNEFPKSWGPTAHKLTHENRLGIRLML
jgi:hypothetical protein